MNVNEELPLAIKQLKRKKYIFIGRHIVKYGIVKLKYSYGVLFIVELI